MRLRRGGLDFGPKVRSVLSRYASANAEILTSCIWRFAAKKRFTYVLPEGC